MNLSTRLDYLRPANLRLRLRPTARPALRPLRNSPKRRPPLWTGRFSVFAGLEFPTRNGRSKAKRPVRHRFAPIRLKSTFEALRREGADFTDLQFALAGGMFARLVRSTPSMCDDPARANGVIRPETHHPLTIVQLHLICHNSYESVVATRTASRPINQVQAPALIIN